MDFDKQLNLGFGAVVGRNKLRIPLVSDFVRGATQQILKIQVDGPLENPRITNTPLPALAPIFKQIEAELQGLPLNPAAQGAGAASRGMRRRK